MGACSWPESVLLTADAATASGDITSYRMSRPAVISAFRIPTFKSANGFPLYRSALYSSAIKDNASRCMGIGWVSRCPFLGSKNRSDPLMSKQILPKQTSILRQYLANCLSDLSSFPRCFQFYYLRRRRLCFRFRLFVLLFCLFVWPSDNWKSCEQILTKFLGRVGHEINFGDDPDHCPDPRVRSPKCGFTGLLSKKLPVPTDFDEILWRAWVWPRD